MATIVKVHFSIEDMLNPRNCISRIRKVACSNNIEQVLSPNIGVFPLQEDTMAPNFVDIMFGDGIQCKGSFQWVLMPSSCSKVDKLSEDKTNSEIDGNQRRRRKRGFDVGPGEGELSAGSY